MKRTDSPERKKGPKFVLSEESLKTIRRFLKEKPSSIIEKTCPMLSALKMMDLSSKERLALTLGIIEDMKLSGAELPDDEVGLALGSVDEYLPRIIEDKKWIYSIQDYIVSKFNNRLATEARRRRRHVPLYVEDENGNVIENPEIKAAGDYRRIENYAELMDIVDKAALSKMEWQVLRFKEWTPYIEELIAEIIGVHRSTVTKSYAKAWEEIRAFLKKYE